MAIVVKRKKNESKGELINRFRRIFMEEGIIDIVREKVHYEKPSRKRYKRQKEIDHRIDINERRSNG